MFRKFLLPFSLLFFYGISAGINSVQAQNVHDTLQTGLTFRTDFECGSLDNVYVLSRQFVPDSAAMRPEGSGKFADPAADSILRIVCNIYSMYDPANPADPKLAPSARWYHFLIGGTKNKEIVLNVKHSDARRPFYSYDGVHYTRFSSEEAPDGQTLKKKYENDSVYIAYFIPYAESYLQKRIGEWSARPSVKVSSLGKSEHGRNMPLLTITNGSPAGKKKIYIHGRVHPSESPASWHLDEMIEILSGDSGYASDLRDQAVFYIVPFTNPDGVQEGMSRSNGEGINIEVNWDSPQSLTAVEVKNIRSFLEKITSDGQPLDVFLNMHSQSDNFATYWIHKAEGTSPVYYKNLVLFSCLTTDGNPFFHNEDLSFSNIAPRYAEGWLWNHFGAKTIALTFETPYTFYNSDPAKEWVTIENLRAMAIHNVYAIGDFLGLQTRARITVGEPEKGKRVKKGSDNNLTYFGNGYLVAKKDGASVKYRLPHVPRGEYEIYKWEVGPNHSPDIIRGNRWVKTGDYSQSKDGKFKYVLSGVENGGIIDSILLLKK